jgi:hypothetical protein
MLVTCTKHLSVYKWQTPKKLCINLQPLVAFFVVSQYLMHSRFLVLDIIKSTGDKKKTCVLWRLTANIVPCPAVLASEVIYCRDVTFIKKNHQSDCNLMPAVWVESLEYKRRGAISQVDGGSICDCSRVVYLYNNMSLCSYLSILFIFHSVPLLTCISMHCALLHVIGYG